LDASDIYSPFRVNVDTCQLFTKKAAGEGIGAICRTGKEA
jgi:hypothetical protein